MSEVKQKSLEIAFTKILTAKSEELFIRFSVLNKIVNKYPTNKLLFVFQIRGYFWTFCNAIF